MTHHSNRENIADKERQDNSKIHKSEPKKIKSFFQRSSEITISDTLNL